MLRHSVLAAVLILGLVGCGGRTPATNGGDGGSVADGPYMLDDAGNIILDDAGNPIPVQQDGAPAQEDGPPGQQDAALQDDAGYTPGIIECGQQTCDAATQQCCVNQQGASCIDIGGDCQGLDVTCDGPEDCPDGEPICCARFGGGGSGVTCQADCQGQALCRLDVDCEAGSRCCGSGTFGGTTYTWCELEADCPNTNPTEGVPCGDVSCTAPEVCCQGWNSSECTAADQCNQGIALACDGPEDCSGGDVCCGDIGMGGGGSECLPAADCQGGGMGSGIICHADTDCPDGETCNDLPYLDIRLCGGGF